MDLVEFCKIINQWDLQSVFICSFGLLYVLHSIPSTRFCFQCLPLSLSLLFIYKCFRLQAKEENREGERENKETQGSRSLTLINGRIVAFYDTISFNRRITKR